MSDKVKTTKEQRQAAAKFHFGGSFPRDTQVGTWIEDGVDTGIADGCIALASLLAKREAKLKDKETKTLMALRATSKAVRTQVNMLLAKVKTWKLRMDQLRAASLAEKQAAEVDASTLRARVAELEVAQADLLKQHYLDLRSIKESTERETKYLANSKALQDALDRKWKPSEISLGMVLDGRLFEACTVPHAGVLVDGVQVPGDQKPMHSCQACDGKGFRRVDVAPVAPVAAIDAIAARTNPSVETLIRYEAAGCPLTGDERETLRRHREGDES